jgi:hypothetical protein
MAVTYLLAEAEHLQPQRWWTSNNQQETGANKWDMEVDGLHRTWAGEDSTNEEEEGLLVMIIAEIRLDELSLPAVS